MVLHVDAYLMGSPCLEEYVDDTKLFVVSKGSAKRERFFTSFFVNAHLFPMVGVACNGTIKSGGTWISEAYG